MRYSIGVFLSVFLITASMIGCKKSELTLYDSPASIYFDLSGSQRDSLLYTFAYTPEKADDTVYLPVKLEGLRTAQARNFILKIDPDSTTAIAGKHYKAIDASYEIPAESGILYVPIILYNTDPLLAKSSVKIKFYLEATPDLGISMPSLTVARLVFSSKLERPEWWDMWMISNGDYYSQVKHQLFIIVTGQTMLSYGDGAGMDAPKNLYFVSQLTSFLNNPAKWVAANPDKGYVLDKIDDNTYHFYNKDTPLKYIVYQYDPVAGQFYFIDENGDRVH